MCEGVAKSIRKLVGRVTFVVFMSASESGPLPSSGTINDLGVEDSSESILDRFFDEGSKILTSG